MNRYELSEKYSEASERYRSDAEKEEKKLIVLSLLRLLIFAGGLALTIFLILRNAPASAFIAAFATVISFIYLIKLYAEHTDKKEFAAALSKINSDECNALSGDISAFRPGIEYADHTHDFSYDVDLFGDKSLFQYLNRTVTGYGSEILSEWLSDPFILTTELKARQEVIRELAGKKEWRHRFMASGLHVTLDKEKIKNLNSWLAENTLEGSSLVRKVLIYLLPVLAVISLILSISGVIHYSLFFLVLLINLGYVTTGLKMTNSIHIALSGSYRYLSSMNSLLTAFSGESFSSEHLNRMKQQVAGDDVSAAFAVKKLGRLIQSFDSRLNIIAGFALNSLLLWDYHCIRRLDNWKAKYREYFPVWLQILGNIDAFSSLGNFGFNNSGFTYPVATGGKIFSASLLGHPLIDEEKRVCNDFELKMPGGICIITGANMAGKSTFLRTVAVNYILAMTGAPVCARHLEFKPVKLFTSMRTTDSLAENESYFYAELKRLGSLKKMILDNEPVFFILDEILKGTNSVDKSLGSVLFIKKLIPAKGTGLIATHDISLGELEKEYPDVIYNMCFEIEIENDRIIFDYKLRKGITKKMNAALLMRQMGIIE